MNTCEIMYGLPMLDDELEKKLDEGKLYLGGCVIEEDAPDHHCNKCGHNFSVL